MCFSPKSCEKHAFFSEDHEKHINFLYCKRSSNKMLISSKDLKIETCKFHSRVTYKTRFLSKDLKFYQKIGEKMQISLKDHEKNLKFPLKRSQKTMFFIKNCGKNEIFVIRL